MLIILFFLFLLHQVNATALSEELCGCPLGCAAMDVVTTIPYDFTYVKKVLTIANEYDYIAFLEVPGRIVFISSANSASVDCTLSDITINTVHYPLINYSPTTCFFNGTFSRAFISLRNLVSTPAPYPGYTIYYKDVILTNRELCGFCECNKACDYGIGLSVGFVAIILALIATRNYWDQVFKKPKKIHIKPS